MQVSTPIQAISSPESNAPPENASSGSGIRQEGVFGDSVGLWGKKKGKAGVFAKLLEGLVVKGKNSGVKADKTEIPGVEAGEMSALAMELGNSEKAGMELGSEGLDKNVSGAGLSTKKTRIPGMEEDFLIAGAAIDDLLTSFGPDSPAGRGFERIHSHLSADVPAARKTDGLPAEGEASPGEANLAEESVLSLVNGKDGETEFSFPGFSSKRPAGRASENPGFSGGEGDSNRTPADFQSAGAGNAEAALFQSRGMTGRALSPDSAENDGGNSSPREIRGKRGREKLNIEVRDLRTPEARDAEAGSGVHSGSKGIAADGLRPAGVEIDLPVDLDLSAGKGEAGKTANESFSQRFEDALARELRGNLSTDIVRDATVIVRNGGEGSIRLSLRPESLGNVKIRLEMTENKITGHIIVESNEAFRAFERELPVLEKAFRDSGFSETTLDMSLAQDGGGSGFGEQRREGDFSALAPVLASSRYEAGIDRVEEQPLFEGVISPLVSGRTQVNLLV